MQSLAPSSFSHSPQQDTAPAKTTQSHFPYGETEAQRAQGNKLLHGTLLLSPQTGSEWTFSFLWTWGGSVMLGKSLSSLCLGFFLIKSCFSHMCLRHALPFWSHQYFIWYFWMGKQLDTIFKWLSPFRHLIVLSGQFINKDIMNKS